MYSTPQTVSRPTSCFGNHWPLPAETVQHTQFGKPHRLDTTIENAKLERSCTGSPSNQSMTDVTDPMAAYPYIPNSNSINRKPPPVHTQTLQEYRSIPMSQQYSNDSPMDTFQSPTSLGSPDVYGHFPSQPGTVQSPSIYLQQPRYNAYTQPPRVHDIRLDDPMQVVQQQAHGLPLSSYADNDHIEPMSAQQSRFGIDASTAEDQFQNYLSPVSVTQARYTEPQGGIIEDLHYQMPPTTYPGAFGQAPDWYKNIKPEETWPGYELPSDRMQSF